MSYEKLFEKNISTKALDDWRASGKKAIGYVCCHVPQEICYAADVLPIRLRATNMVDSSDAETWMSSFSCSYARGILQYLMDGFYKVDGVVQSDGCMMASRIYDNWEHVAENKLNIPQEMHQVDAPRITNDYTIAFYKTELQELADHMAKMSGKEVTNAALKEAVEKQNEVRRLVKDLYDLRDKGLVSGTEALQVTLASCDMHRDDYVAALKEFLADAKDRKPIEARARLMIIGSALDNPEYLKVIEDKGGLIVTDDFCFGQKAFANEIVIEDENDVLGSIAKYYLTRNTCPRALDNRPSIHNEIVEEAKKRNVQGVIYQKMQNCECWGGESYYLEPDLKAAGIPMLIVEREEQMANAGQLAIRAEAFVEMIEE